MSTVNPKWIQYDDNTFTSVDIDGVSNLTQHFPVLVLNILMEVK